MKEPFFYDFDVTSGSAIQAEALFDIFDDLSSIVKRKRMESKNIGYRKITLMNSSNRKKGFP